MKWLYEVIMAFELGDRVVTLTEKRVKGETPNSLRAKGIKPYVVRYITPTTEDLMEYSGLPEASEKWNQFRDFTLKIATPKGQ